MSGFQGPVYVALRPSAVLLRVLIGTHVFVALCVALAYPFSYPQCALIGAILLNGAVSTWRYVHQRHDDVTAVLLTTRGGWSVRLRSGTVLNASMPGDPFLTRSLTVLQLKLESGSVKRVLLLNDNVDADPYRRLRVRLRLIHKRGQKPIDGDNFI